MPHLMKTSLRKKMRMRKKFKITLSWKLMIKFSHWLRTNLHKPLNLLLSMLFYPLCQFIQKNLAQSHLVSPFSTFFPPSRPRPKAWLEFSLTFWICLFSPTYLFSLISLAHVFCEDHLTKSSKFIWNYWHISDYMNFKSAEERSFCERP